MAEAIAVIGFAAALLDFVEFGTKVIRHLHEFEEQSKDNVSLFKGIRNRLPLTINLVEQIRLQMEAGLIDEKTEAAMRPVVESCLAEARELDKIFMKTLPGPKDKFLIRVKQAFHSVGAEHEVQRIDASLFSNYQLLAQASTLHSFNRRERPQLITATSSYTWSPTIQVAVSQPEQHDLADLAALQLQISNSKTTLSQSVFMVPFSRDPNFLGRQDVLQSISNAFETDRFVTIAGLGGIGKSQIAIEYCYRFRDSHPYHYVFWIYAAEPHHFEQGYQELARKARVPGWDDPKTDKLKLVQDWLQDEKTTDWLMVVDNADDASMFFRTRSDGAQLSDTNSKLFAKYFPQSSHGQILITTRDRRLGTRLSSGKAIIEVTALSKETSKDLLRNRISEDDWREDHATQLVEYLSYLPLAITQAAAFISENSITVSEYLEMLSRDEKEREDLLGEDLHDPRRDMESENSVFRTWKLSFEQILKESPRAADIVSLLAMIDYHGVPLLHLRKQIERETAFRVALGILQAFSLITATRGENAICKMHRLVAISTRTWLERRGTIEFWKSQALNVVAPKFPGPGHQGFQEFPTMLALMPHAQIILGYQFETTDDQLMAAGLLISTALFDLSSARYSQAFEKCERSLKIREDLLPSDDPDLLESIQTLGETLLHRGELKAARSMLQRAIDGRGKKLGFQDIDTLESLSDMTITLLELNDLQAAEETARKALDGREAVLGHKHPDYLVSLNIMAIYHQLKGEYEIALEMTERVLREREGLLGASAPDTLMTLNNLARLKLEMGELDAAEQMLDRTLEGEQTALAPNGYDIQITLSNKAAVLVKKQRYQEAERILRDVLAMRERSFGPFNPATLLTLATLADVLEKQGNVVDANTQRKRIASAGGEAREEVGALLCAGLLFD